jgi:manganese transport protein
MLPTRAGTATRARRGLPSRRALLPFLGPAFIACVAYIDPGNFATNIAAGAKFGYALLWVVVAANLMAMLIQTLSAKLGIATGRNLPEVCREQYSRRTAVLLWIQAEAVAMATDLAEFLGAALGFHLLLGIPLFPAALLTAVASFLILGLQRFGVRPLEAVIAAIVGIIGACYVGELHFAHPALGSVVHHAVVPSLGGSEQLLLAVGILGATVMPHVIYLHSALLQSRIVPDDLEEARILYRFTRVDVVAAMSLAGLINVAMLAVAAAVFSGRNIPGLGDLQVAGRTLEPLLGGAAKTLFALALLCSGLASSAVGTLAGQVVMQGFLRRTVPIWVRRVVTMLPALIVIALGADPTRTLVVSQVLLSFGIPFALIPLVRFTSDRRLMGGLVNARATTGVAILVAALIVTLNAVLLVQTLLL